MPNPVVHFEIIGTAPGQLQEYYGKLFGWTFELGDTSSAEVSEPGAYGFVPDSIAGINGGVGGGPSLRPKVLFYVGVEDVGAALSQAESLGGRRVFGPDGAPGQLVVAQFTDPEGNLIGLAGPA
ncbi:putative enzyme related to lactoylglutathione lyase [Kribbella aluminosa]|uniref:Enzyme related to lactoylglutathione lyase n=1 Tax=Kribbella aluminosa TaxID=416017 RepID=A0ABS4UMV5_9ACTN|nr:VOC family protein [Kribbella aluminosa]MBP2352963.1 putative enzyme related to lactoylglutathione lyase [Kribbella aluminosa]